MRPQQAARAILDTLSVRAERDPDGVSIEHACWMLEGLALGYIQHETAHRWLGYAQAILVTSGTNTLDEMKQVNKATTAHERQSDG